MVNIIKKGFRKICRSLVKNAFLPNSIRVFLLKMTGVTIGSQVIINEGFTLLRIALHSDLMLQLSLHLTRTTHS